MMYPDTYIAWDLETSGLDPCKDRILEIGAIKVKGHEIIDSKSWMLNHGIEITPTITNITGITKEMIDQEGVSPDVALREFGTMFKEHSWANLTHNGFRFDIPFLVEEFKRSSIEAPQGWDGLYRKLMSGCIDTAVIFKAKQLNMQRMWNEDFTDFALRVMNVRAFGVKYNVAHCCNELGIDTSDATFHRALGDVTLTHKIYKRLHEVGANS